MVGVRGENASLKAAFIYSFRGESKKKATAASEHKNVFRPPTAGRPARRSRNGGNARRSLGRGPPPKGKHSQAGCQSKSHIT